jgi:hypothetical protein
VIRAIRPRLVRAALAALLALAAAAGPAAAVTVGDYQKWRLIDRTWRTTPTSVLEVRLLGIFQGLLLANRIIEKRGGRRLFCPDEATELTGRKLREWVDAEIKSPSLHGGKPYRPDTAIEAVVLVVAARKFPCKTPPPKAKK